jgi:uncharacterized protein (TIGR00730 family)
VGATPGNGEHGHSLKLRPMTKPKTDAPQGATESPSGKGGAARIVRNFPTAEQEIRATRERLAQASRYGGADSSYKLAFADDEFMLRDDQRPIRMQMELLKPELVQREEGIDATVVIFGSARILPMDAAREQLAKAQAGGDATALRRAQVGVELAVYYEEARRFAQLVTKAAEQQSEQIVVCTGGGPGIMEAGNRGAMEAGGKSVGLNIVLPHEQEPNPYITPRLCFLFHYFGLRKMHFLMRAMGLVCFPGGFGTLDEMFEVLTLTQTKKARKRPIVLVGKAFWNRLIDWNYLVDTGMISPEDLQLFSIVDTADEAWAALSHELGLDLPQTQTGEFAVDI